ncbi:hypothetical protein MPSEU_000505500 [Mayamaea pseudoterrestris]|nr:hypothetical protein MPSEU_000505500 [Mayamaea pseudoterrestris]
MIKIPPHHTAVPWARVVTATILSASSFYIYRLLSRHGYDGTLRLLWEGSPYPLESRVPHEALDDASNNARTLQTTIRALEVALDNAHLAEESNFSSILIEWQKNVQPMTADLRQELAVLSHNLDLLAASVDTVLSDNDLVKQRKKDLSLKIVNMMERADALISFYTKASDPVV